MSTKIKNKNQLTLFIIVVNYIPLVFTILVFIVSSCASNFPAKILVFFGLLYLAPPVLVRLIILIIGRPLAMQSTQGDREYRLWWVLTQFQVIFNRFPVLEETLRLVPGLYNFWLNIWGGKVHLFAYWSPGAVVMDRYHINIGKAAVIGGYSGITGHIISRNDAGQYILTTAPVILCEGAILGAGAALSPGVIVEKNEVIPAGTILAPFTTWQNGKKVKRNYDR